MPDSLVPIQPQQAQVQGDVYGGGEYAAPVQAKNPLERPIAAVRRYKWLIAGVCVLALLAGGAGWKLAKPLYDARATLWVTSENPNRLDNGPIRAGELLNGGSWIELFRSFRILDEVVRKLGLYLEPGEPSDKPLFVEFTIADRFMTGSYVVTVDPAKKTWVLTAKMPRLLRRPHWYEVERGSAGDSVGKKAGFLWVLPKAAFEGAGERRIPFTVRSPRQKSVELLDDLRHRMPLGSNFLWLGLTSEDSKIGARTLNEWVNKYMEVAADLKKKNLVEFRKILEEQLRYAERATQDAEAAYQNFRVNTITLPTDAVPIAAGAAGGGSAGDPALASFFNQKIEYDNLRQDRDALEKGLANASMSGARYEGLLLIPSVAQSPGAEALRAAFGNQYQLQAQLSVLRQQYTDEHPTVAQLIGNLEVLQKQTIPLLANQLLMQLKDRENEINRRISVSSRELQQIPPRTIEERRLARAVAVAEGLYTTLKMRYAEAQLAEASSIPDIALLDTAVASSKPTLNTGPRVFLMIAAAGIGAAFALAILLDMIDRRIRYSDQVSELGLPIAGAIPKIPKGGINSSSPDQVVQFVESFRSLRMQVMHGARTQRIVLAVTSAAPADGKSLVSANLALSFADAGLRTILVDADTRRGSLHKMFALKAPDGLTECLTGAIDLATAIRTTSHENLSFMSCGRRHQRSPELLASRQLQQLVGQLSQQFDVVIFDTPPLAAGIDGYAISAAARSILMVLRMGETERRLISAKLAVLDRLPVEVVGAVLNGVPLTGEFQYYAYSRGYNVDHAETVELVPSAVAR